jgi:hypothetical protein
MPWLMLALALLLGGCESSMETYKTNREREAQVNITPQNYRAEIVAFMRTYLNDPTNVRDAMISEPGLRTLEGGPRSSVCLRYNAKKPNDQYAGIKNAVAIFREGRFDHMIDGRVERPGGNDRASDVSREQCKDAAYAPFSELERMTR